MISIIVARSENNVIGKGGRIPWKIKGEQRQFKELTRDSAVIMGRKSYEEIGHPLPDRLNIVISSTQNFTGDNLVTVKSLAEALKAAGSREIFVAGGAGLFEEALPLADNLYITEVHLTVEDGDTFFPAFDPSAFTLETGETKTGEMLSAEAESIKREAAYTRTVYRRKSKE